MEGNNLNTLGLILDIIGVVLLFKYGLPDDISPSGSVSLDTEDVNEDDIKLYKIYKRKSRIALGFLITGFILQAVSNYI